MRSEIEIVALSPDYFDGLAQLQRAAYPTLALHELLTAEHFANHYRLCPECQVVAIAHGPDGDQVVGCGSGFFMDFDFEHPDHTFQEIISQGFFSNHDPNGSHYYGADISVHPDFRGRGVGRMIYEARKAVVRRANRRGIIAGGLIPEYEHWKATLSPHDYVDRVVRGEIYDSTLTFQLRNGFLVRGLLQEYIADPRSDNWGTLIEWPNPDWQPDPVALPR